MNNPLYAPFFNATRDVFKLMLDLSNISDKPLLDKDVSAQDSKINIEIGIIGDLQGKVIYHFPKQTSLEMVKIMSGMEFSEIDDFVTSALGEIANIISGNVMSTLSVQKISCDILSPHILNETGDTTEINYEFESGMQICTDIGSVDLNIILNTK
ncbi:MAG: chemotaxis protein CheX [Syntrophomonadaceae bacterium]|nr:chemotaxis protein CheX [Syntrophomonadaceae bacterium]